MATSSIAVRTTSVGASTAQFSWRNTSATRRVFTMELAIFAAAATSATLGFGTASTAGVDTSPVTMLRDDPGDPASLVVTARAWSTALGVPSLFKRRGVFANVIGAGVIWTFPRGMSIAPSGVSVLWNVASNPASDVHVVVEEG